TPPNGAPVDEALRQINTLSFIKECSNGNVDAVDEQLRDKSQFHLNGIDENGTPALVYAVMLGHVEVVRLLLEHGADPTIKDAKGRDARKWASRSVNADIKDMVGGDSSAASPTISRPASTSQPRTPTLDIASPKIASPVLSGLRAGLAPESQSPLNGSNESISPERLDFDWTTAKPGEMCPFDPDDAAHILNVAIRTIVPKKKAKFAPLGANVLFLCARYACYHSSTQVGTVFLEGSCRVIQLWLMENGMDSYVQMYWLSNALQLLIYLKRDSKLIEDTLPAQIGLSDLVDDILSQVWTRIRNQLEAVVVPALVDWQSDDSRLEIDFFGFAKRKT
ncbi:hypothetical protein HDU91_004198, partial [Kappamyces sp. JEL0680]